MQYQARCTFCLMSQMISGLLLCVILSVSSSAAAARDFSLRYGVKSDDSTLDAFPSTKYLSLGIRDDISLFVYQYEVGTIIDTNPGRSTSAFGIASIGLETKTENIFGFYLLGAGLFSSPDSLLSSVFEFSHDLGIGFKDKRGVGVDLAYRHISNAGLVPPNPGRNFLIMRLSVPWNTVF